MFGGDWIGPRQVAHLSGDDGTARANGSKSELFKSGGKILDREKMIRWGNIDPSSSPVLGGAQRGSPRRRSCNCIMYSGFELHFSRHGAEVVRLDSVDTTPMCIPPDCTARKERCTNDGTVVYGALDRNGVDSLRNEPFDNTKRWGNVRCSCVTTALHFRWSVLSKV